MKDFEEESKTELDNWTSGEYAEAQSGLTSAQEAVDNATAEELEAA